MSEMGQWSRSWARGLATAAASRHTRWRAARLPRVVLAGFLTVFVCTASAGAAVASGWSTDRLPAPATAPAGGLVAVSCVSATVCFAVGATPFGGLVERWNGRRWSIQRATGQGGGTQQNGAAELTGVSCVSVRFCEAVGSSSGYTLFERWNGRHWALQRPARGSGFALVSSVSCGSVSLCFAVGGWDVQRWNGSRWSEQTYPIPGPTTAVSFTSVACASSTSCMATGDFQIGCGDVGPCDIEPLVERWDGSAWSIVQAPKARGLLGLNLDSVACVGVTDCMIVGSSRHHNRLLSFAARWLGAGWSLHVFASPRGASLTAVSCATAASCTAFGSFARGGQLTTPFAEHWNGAGWSRQKLRIPRRGSVTGLAGRGDVTSLAAVSCPLAGRCVAVGQVTDHEGDQAALAEQWVRSRWSLQRPPNVTIPLPADLQGVSCSGTTACMAVGNTTDVNEVALIEHRNGSTWTVQPNPAGTYTSGNYESPLVDVSCASAADCIAVGQVAAATGNDIKPLVERWAGARWTLQNPPSPTGAASSGLSGISCSAANACMAVGSFATAAGVSQEVFAERWDGTEWEVQDIASPCSALRSELTKVSCTSASSCIAVGDYSGSLGQEMPLVGVWDGSSWTMQPVPVASGTTTGRLSGVSCVSVGACVAVGQSYQDGSFRPLVEAWDGSSWMIQSTPLPPLVSGSHGDLSGVSCTSTTACTAVGGYHGYAGGHSLVERWDGSSWSIDPGLRTPLDTAMNAVSCTTGTACTTVGSFLSIVDATGGPQSFLITGRSF